MNIHKVSIAVGLIIALSLFLGLVAHADEADQATTISFSEPVQIPGQVLPAGTYVFRLLDGDLDLHVVQIFNADRTVLYATVQTIPTDRPKATDRTVVALAQRGTGQPDALLRWFYPEQTTGTEFLYPKQEERELGQDKQQTIVADRPAVSNSETAGVGN
ncbi:MAG: hypothetical protein ABR880_03320 [Candidatus Sulfotelmatobacter sp.]|jgi:hypothetical protein